MSFTTKEVGHVIPPSDKRTKLDCHLSDTLYKILRELALQDNWIIISQAWLIHCTKIKENNITR